MSRKISKVRIAYQVEHDARGILYSVMTQGFDEETSRGIANAYARELNRKHDTWRYTVHRALVIGNRAY